jgi:hypothetical protein
MNAANGQSTAPETMGLKETKPSGPLARFVDCYWTIASKQVLKTSVPNRILPDGCLDIIFVNGGSLQLTQGDTAARRLPQAFIVGPMKTSNVVLLGGVLDIFGIRFKPGGAYPFLQTPLDEMADQHVPLADAWESSGAQLAEQLAGDGPFARRISRLESFLLRELCDCGDEPDWLSEVIKHPK